MPIFDATKVRSLQFNGGSKYTFNKQHVPLPHPFQSASMMAKYLRIVAAEVAFCYE
jgi:hypothetical protein